MKPYFNNKQWFTTKIVPTAREYLDDGGEAKLAALIEANGWTPEQEAILRNAL